MIAGRVEWCREGGSNPHGREGRRILSPLRLPVPPSRHEEERRVDSRVGASGRRALRLRNFLSIAQDLRFAGAVIRALSGRRVGNGQRSIEGLNR